MQTQPDPSHRPAFTRRHYEAIAEALRDSTVPTPGHVAYTLAHLFERDNPRFDTARFLDAVFPGPRCAFCGQTEGQRPHAGPVQANRPGWLPHVLFHDRCAEDARKPDNS